MKQWHKRRRPTPPTIGQLKPDIRIARDDLTVEIGDQNNAVFAALGYKITNLLAEIHCANSK